MTTAGHGYLLHKVCKCPPKEPYSHIVKGSLVTSRAFDKQRKCFLTIFIYYTLHNVNNWFFYQHTQLVRITECRYMKFIEYSHFARIKQFSRVVFSLLLRNVHNSAIYWFVSINHVRNVFLRFFSIISVWFNSWIPLDLWEILSLVSPPWVPASYSISFSRFTIYYRIVFKHFQNNEQCECSAFLKTQEVSIFSKATFIMCKHGLINIYPHSDYNVSCIKKYYIS